MDEKKRNELDNLLTVMRAHNSAFLGLVGMPPIPLVGGIPPMPIPTEPTLAPYLQALRRHGEDFDKLITIVQELLKDR